LEKGSALRAARLHLHPPQVRCIPTAEAGGFTPGFGKKEGEEIHGKCLTQYLLR
jgi:hypothetical protein